MRKPASELIFWSLIAVMAQAMCGCVSRSSVLAELKWGQASDPVFLPAVWRGQSGVFILDTGTNAVVLDERTFASIRARQRRSEKVETGSGKEIEAEICDAPDLIMGPFHLEGGSVAARIDLSTVSRRYHRRVFGLFGLWPLRRFVFQFDSDAQKVRMYRADDEKHPEWGAAHQLVWIGELPAIEADILGKKYGFVIDSGDYADGLTMPKAAFDRLQTTNHEPLFVRTSNDLSGEVTSRAFRIPRLDFAGIACSNLLVVEGHGEVGVIPRGFFSHHLVTLDFPNHRAYFK